jgi:hypothetical protein
MGIQIVTEYAKEETAFIPTIDQYSVFAKRRSPASPSKSVVAVASNFVSFTRRASQTVSFPRLSSVCSRVCVTCFSCLQHVLTVVYKCRC